jgi:hypothetical protein
MDFIISVLCMNYSELWPCSYFKTVSVITNITGTQKIDLKFKKQGDIFKALPVGVQPLWKQKLHHH